MRPQRRRSSRCQSSREREFVRRGRPFFIFLFWCVCLVCAVRESCVQCSRKRERRVVESPIPRVQQREECAVRAEGITVSLWLRQEGLLGTNALHLPGIALHTDTHASRLAFQTPADPQNTHRRSSSPQNNTRSLCFKQPARQAPLSLSRLSCLPTLLPETPNTHSPQTPSPSKYYPPSFSSSHT